MEDENIFEYGPYKLYKDAFKENLAKNIDKYIKDHNLTDPEVEQDFRAAVDFIRDGIGSHIIHMNGSGVFRDNKGYLTSTKQGHKYAANYINFIANKQGSLGNATPKKKEEKEIIEEKKKILFDPNKHLIGLEFENSANPLGNDSGYSLWKEGSNNPLDQLRQYITTHKASLNNYDFSGTNLTKDFYEKSLNSLLSNLGDNEISEKDAEMMSRLGFKNPKAFMPQQEDPTPIVSNLSEERLAQLMDLNWKIDPTSKNWLDPTGYNTQLPATVDPENPGEEYKEQFAAWQQYNKGNNAENEKVNIEEIDNNYKDFISTFAPTLATLGSILNPEPISGTIMGLAGDFGNAYNNSQDEDGFTLSDWGELGLNVLGTAAGAIPYIGDLLGNVPKLYKGFRDSWKVTSRLIESLGIAGTIWYGEETWNFIKDSLTNIINKDKDEITKEDWANALNAITEITQLYKNIKAGKVYSDAKRASQLKDAVTVKGSDKKKHILTGQDAINVKDLQNLDDVKSQLGDFGFEPIELPRSNKNIYNPDLLKREAGDSKFSRARGWAERQSNNTVMHTRRNNTENAPETPSNNSNKPAKIKTVDDLRNTVKAKLQADGKSEEVIEQVDALLRNVKTDDRGLFTKGWQKIRGAKYSDEFEQAVGILVNNGYNRSKATELLLSVGLHKEGGILKAQAGNSAPITGTPKNTNPWYSSIGAHFMTDLIKSISDGKFTYMNVNMMQDRHSDLESRLGKTVDNPIFDSATEQYYKDINQFDFVNNKGIKAGEDTQRYKVNPNAYTNDTYNEDPNKAWNPDGYYSGRGQDRTLLGRKGDYSDEELAAVTQAWKDAGYEMYLNDKNNYYYLKETAVTPEDQKSDPKEKGVESNKVKPGEVDGSDLMGDNNSKEIAPTGNPMTKKSNRSWEPAFSAFNYFNALRTNKQILNKTNELTPLLYDPVEHPRIIHGDLQAIAEGQQQAAEFARQAATPMTSDGSLQQAMQMEAKLKGQESIRAGLKADNDEVKRTTDLAIAQEKEDKNVRHQVAMKNRENMHQVDLTKLQAETTKIRSDYESTKNFVDEIKRYHITEHAKKQKIDDTIYARALQQDIYKNPQNYMPGLNTYHDDIWKRGIAGKQLTSEEQTVFAQLKQQFINAYYSNLYYNTTPIDTSVKDITNTASDWAIVRSLATQKEKRGGKLNKDDAKIVLEFLKESNKNYNKAVDRSARGMYNHIKLQRKK